jgi:hypothetical protein
MNHGGFHQRGAVSQIAWRKTLHASVIRFGLQLWFGAFNHPGAIKDIEANQPILNKVWVHAERSTHATKVK